jgi:hypothetical protein
MTYDILVIIVVINTILTLSLWGKVASKSNRGRPQLNRKAAAALWRSEPIIPKHDPPKTAGAEFSSSLASDVDQYPTLDHMLVVVKIALIHPVLNILLYRIAWQRLAVVNLSGKKAVSASR